MPLRGNPVTVLVSQEWHVAKAQRAVKVMASAAGLSQIGVYSLATSVSELANNLFFHTRDGGTITLTAVRQNGRAGIEVVAQDDGPGIADVGMEIRPASRRDGGQSSGVAVA